MTKLPVCAGGMADLQSDLSLSAVGDGVDDPDHSWIAILYIENMIASDGQGGMDLMPAGSVVFPDDLLVRRHFRNPELVREKDIPV